MKTTIITLVLLLFVSCSKDEPFKDDPIVGKWSYEWLNGYEITGCKTSDYELFNADGSYFRKDCDEDYPFDSGFWRHIDGNNYMIEYRDVRGGIYRQYVIVQFTDENTMRLHYQLRVYQLKKI